MALEQERIRTMPCGCHYDVKSGAVTAFCPKHTHADYAEDEDGDNEDGYDDEQPLFDPDEAGR